MPNLENDESATQLIGKSIFATGLAGSSLILINHFPSILGQDLKKEASQFLESDQSISSANSLYQAQSVRDFFITADKDHCLEGAMHTTQTETPQSITVETQFKPEEFHQCLTTLSDEFLESSKEISFGEMIIPSVLLVTAGSYAIGAIKKMRASKQKAETLEI